MIIKGASRRSKLTGAGSSSIWSRFTLIRISSKRALKLQCCTLLSKPWPLPATLCTHQQLSLLPQALQTTSTEQSLPNSAPASFTDASLLVERFMFRNKATDRVFGMVGLPRLTDHKVASLRLRRQTWLPTCLKRHSILRTIIWARFRIEKLRKI